jgi:hypothetical protein
MIGMGRLESQETDFSLLLPCCNLEHPLSLSFLTMEVGLFRATVYGVLETE